jgi:hypothetical protein
MSVAAAFAIVALGALLWRWLSQHAQGGGVACAACLVETAVLGLDTWCRGAQWCCSVATIA